MTTPMVLRLTDGTATLTLTDNVSYAIRDMEWRPKVARRLQSQMGGAGLYANVIEEIPLHVRGATGATALANLAAVANMLDQAERWARGEMVAPIILEYLPANSAATDYYKAVVVGAPGDTFWDLSPRMNSDQNHELDGITLYLERRGLWLRQESISYVENGSFEDWDGSDFDDWTVTGMATIDQEMSPVKDGMYSASLEALSNAVIWQDIGLAAGIIQGYLVTVTAWVYLTSGIAKLGAWDGTTFFNEVSETTAVTGQWVQLRVQKKVASTGVRVGIAGDLSVGVNCVIDDIRVELDFAAADFESYYQSAATDNGDVATIDFGSSENVQSPTRLVIQDMRLGTYHRTAYLIVANATNAINVVDAEDLVTSGVWSAPSDSAAYARGGNVLRYTPAATSEVYLQISSSVLTRRLAIFATVRNNSSTTTFRLRLRNRRADTTEYSRPVFIEGQASPRPEPIFLGEIVATAQSEYDLCVQASAASGTIDFDSIVIVSLNVQPVAILAIHEPDGDGYITTDEPIFLAVDHRLLTSPTPRAAIVSLGYYAEWSAQGVRDIFTSARDVEVLLLATGSDASANTWRQVASSAVVQNTFTATRLPGSLIPE